ncbi:uncharacterized protein BJX67DRAFT_61556 [Aspergillus lucknowensis]|uniref:Uncharacterized protein n=1 Tax=Aspergillus lucknowensis TaxID=176173 RepID=A0ABR4LUB0_9EURO
MRISGRSRKIVSTTIEAGGAEARWGRDEPWCLQVETRWPRTQASQAHFSPSMSIPWRRCGEGEERSHGDGGRARCDLYVWVVDRGRGRRREDGEGNGNGVKQSNDGNGKERKRRSRAGCSSNSGANSGAVGRMAAHHRSRSSCCVAAVKIAQPLVDMGASSFCFSLSGTMGQSCVVFSPS